MLRLSRGNTKPNGTFILVHATSQLDNLQQTWPSVSFFLMVWPWKVCYSDSLVATSLPQQWSSSIFIVLVGQITAAVTHTPLLLTNSMWEGWLRFLPGADCFSTKA